VLTWRFGYRLRSTDPEIRAQSGWQPDNLRKRGFAPATLIDVGVARGTPDLYAAFPDAYLVLIEPLQEFEPHLQEIVNDRPGEYILSAAGAGEDERTIRIDPERPFLSSLYTVAQPRRQAPPPVERTVSVISLDALRRERGWKPPFGLKIDTEGFEHEVARGATDLLTETEFVIAEVSVARRFQETPSFASFVALMAENGFRLYDILDGQKGSVGGEVIWLDLLFRGDPSAARSDGR
jgi:FkbM family methyltransferase